jgi:GNAT superfamily N-acetyltransferase
MTADGIAIALLPAADSHDAHVAGELARLVNDVYRAAEEGIWRDGTSRTTAAEVAELIAAGQVAVAVRDGRLVGVVRVRDVAAGAGEFGMLAASPEHRGTGVGRALVEFAERRARDRGLRAMRLELFVPREQPNPTKEFLQAWYGRLGYELAATVPVQDAYPDLAPRLATPCDIYCYEKPLSA